MSPGQRVMVVASWHESECIPPKIGSTGVITEPIDRDGDYYVLVDDYPCPTDHEPEWFIPAWALVPIDDMIGTQCPGTYAANQAIS